MRWVKGWLAIEGEARFALGVSGKLQGRSGEEAVGSVTRGATQCVDAAQARCCTAATERVCRLQKRMRGRKAESAKQDEAFGMAAKGDALVPNLSAASFHAWPKRSSRARAIGVTDPCTLPTPVVWLRQRPEHRIAAVSH